MKKKKVKLENHYVLYSLLCLQDRYDLAIGKILGIKEGKLYKFRKKHKLI